MIGISWADYYGYGCVNCGCRKQHIDDQINDTNRSKILICEECTTEFSVLADGVKKISLIKKDDCGNCIVDKVRLAAHPRKGIPWHILTEDSVYWRYGSIGYGVVKSKEAGEHLIKMVKDVLGNDNPRTCFIGLSQDSIWMVRFIEEEFDLYKLREFSKKSGCIITKNILEKCKKCTINTN